MDKQNAHELAERAASGDETARMELLDYAHGRPHVSPHDVALTTILEPDAVFAAIAQSPKQNANGSYATLVCTFPARNALQAFQAFYGEIAAERKKTGEDMRITVRRLDAEEWRAEEGTINPRWN